MATEKRTPRQHNVNPGIYLGKVISHLDTQFMGGLEVELLKRKGAANTSGTVIQCRYASPFYGQLSYEGMQKSNSFSSTQQSYGFWAVPPDAGTLVIVVMPEGDYSQAFWIGCVPDTGMNFMTPGHASDGVTYVIDGLSGDFPRAAIVGDAIFAGSMGGAPTHFELAKAKISEIILSLPQPTLICPGHGPLTTLKEEQSHNPFF